MKAVIVNFRGGRHTQLTNQMVVLIEGITTRDKATGLIGKIVIWTSPAKKEIKGKITAIHGNKGAVRVHFERGMPGQSVGKTVTIK